MRFPLNGENVTVTIKIEEGLDRTTVYAHYSGVIQIDRRYLYGHVVGKADKKGLALAQRMERCILAGAGLPTGEVKTDVNNKTYISADCIRLCGRFVNANLKKLGY